MNLKRILQHIKKLLAQNSDTSMRTILGSLNKYNLFVGYQTKFKNSLQKRRR